MARGYMYRSLLLSSLFAAVGSFLIDVGSAVSAHALWVAIWLQRLLEADRALVVTTLLEVIALAAAGLVLIRVFSWRQGE